MNIILGIYYNETVDTQRNAHAPSDSYEYFEKWHKSIKSLNLFANNTKMTIYHSAEALSIATIMIAISLIILLNFWTSTST